MNVCTDIESNISGLKALVSILPEHVDNTEIINEIISKATYVKDLIILSKDKQERFVGCFKKWTEFGYDIYYHPIGKMSRKQAMLVLDADIPTDWGAWVTDLDLIVVDEETLNQFFIAVRLSKALKCMKHSDCPNIHRELSNKLKRLFKKLNLDPTYQYVI